MNQHRPPWAGSSAGPAAAFSTVQAPSPALPKGGGAIRGLGEAFRVSPATGTCAFEVPLGLTPGRQGFGPSLLLSYDSGAGNGVFGVGWRLSLPAITRKTDKGIPVYDDGDGKPGCDIFLLSGFEDLVPGRRAADGAPDVVEMPEHVATRFRPRAEGAFARIETVRRKGTQDACWRVITRDNVTHVYGETAAARIVDPGHRIVHPSQPHRVFSWLLERSEDDRGNVILYEYAAEDLVGVPWKSHESGRRERRAPFTNRYLKRIRWGNTVPFDRTGASCVFEAVFDYGEHDPEQPTPEPAPGQTWTARQDPFSWYRAGFEIRTYRLCRRVLMFHRFAELGPEPTLVRSVDLGYDEAPTLTRLTSITRRGYQRPAGSTGAYTVKGYPPIELGYTMAAPTKCKTKQLEPDLARELAGRKPGQDRWVDLDGEGLPGLLSEMGGALNYRRNEGGGRLAPARRLRNRPAAVAGMMPQMLDVGGDGQLDVVVLANGVAGYHEREPENDGWGPFMPFSSQPRIDWNDPSLRFLDINGDGIDDLLLVHGNQFIWFESLGKQGYGPARTFPRGGDDERGPTALVAQAGQAIFLADMTGDGLRDIVRIAEGNVCYWPNQGHGKFGAKVSMSNSPRFARHGDFDARRIRLGDVDGSGTTDILYAGGEGGARVWRNQAGNSWSAAEKLEIYPDADAHVELLDLLGHGTACLVWTSARVWTAYMLDLAGGKKPYLLERVVNNLGLETRMAYAPSTKFYLADRAAGRPWETKLPFPVHVLERVETYDHVSRVRRVSEYRYHHGCYDGEDREFCGFGMVEQVDTEAFSAASGKGLFPEVTPRNGEMALPPVLKKTWMHLGVRRPGAAATERSHESEYWSGDVAAPRLPEAALPSWLGVEDRKQALRALRGRILREEVFSLDGSAEQGRPYSVVETNWSVRREQPTKWKWKDRGVYFVAPREVVSLYYDRYAGENGAPDPRVEHAFTLVVDEYGSVRKSATVAYPRRWAPADEDHAAQRQLAIIVTETDVAHLANVAAGYRLGIPLETRTIELHQVTPPAGVFSFEQIAALTEQAGALEHEDWPPEPGASLPPGPLARVIERVRVRYCDSADLLNPLPFGTVDLLALPYESYQLALTPGQIAKRFNAIEERVTPAILAEGGYVALLDQPGWWIPSGRQVLDAARFHLPTSFINPWGAATAVDYDAHALLATRTEDALGNQIAVENDYRTLSPVMITDPNGNRAAVRLDELGMVIATAVMGKVGSADGDTLDDPTTTLEHDLFWYQTTGKPNFVRIRARERHGDPAARWIESYSYSDGSGHETMRKVMAKPGPAPVLDPEGKIVVGPDGEPALEHAASRWIGTGRTVLDNKGNVVKQYEPYFSRTHEYEDDDDLVQWGVTPVFHRDPLGRLVRTDFPNGTSARVEFTPWSQTSWDANDTVLDPGNLWYAARQPGATPAPSAAEQRAATLAAAHAGTRTVTELGVLGRPFLSVSDLGNGKKIRTRTTLDIEGNPLVVTDARGNDAMICAFDVAGRKIHQKSIDAGERWALSDVMGNPLRAWDSRGHTVRTAYDVLRRPTELWVQVGNGPEVNAERTVYGEEHPSADVLNLRGKVYQQYDGAGLAANEAFDFKGNLLASSRRLGREYKAQLDWSASPGPVLDAEAFTTASAYDALNRPISLIKPDQSEIRPAYNEAGLLEAVDVRLRGAAAWTAFVENIDYDAKGQRERIVYGNGVITEHSYDPLTFRLKRIKTTRPSDGALLQDLRYSYDPVGNIVEIEDLAQSTIYHNNQVVDPVSRYEYDALYRLTHAEGREHAGQNADVQQDQSGFPLVTSPHPNDPQALRSYTELYQYDDVGNILATIHHAGSGSWTRRYEIAPGNNRLLSTSLPGDQPAGPYSAKYTHDAHGNMTSMPHLASIGWDFKDQMRQTDLGGGGEVYFVYDRAGERVRKVWEHSGIVEDRVYLGGYEVYRRREEPQAEVVLERQTLHVMNGANRVALVETKTVDAKVPPLTPTPRIRYQMGNHLGSAALEVDESGLVISYEEYHPFGTTAYQAARAGVEVGAKRYRYTGKERDEETGLYYHGARYFAPWLMRWVSCDPIGLVDGNHLYCYVRSNPIGLLDPDGRDPTVFLYAMKAWDKAKKLADDAGEIAAGAGEGAVELGSSVAGFVLDPVAGTKQIYQNAKAEFDAAGGGVIGARNAINTLNPLYQVATSARTAMRAAQQGDPKEYGRNLFHAAAPILAAGIAGGPTSPGAASVAAESAVIADANIAVAAGSKVGAQAGGVAGPLIAMASTGAKSKPSGGSGPAEPSNAVASPASKSSEPKPTTAEVAPAPASSAPKPPLQVGATPQAPVQVNFSRMPHAVERAVGRAGLGSKAEANAALREFSARVSRGEYAEAILDSSYPDRIIVPGFQGNTAIVYRIMPRGHLELRTVLDLDPTTGLPGPEARFTRVQVQKPAQ